MTNAQGVRAKVEAAIGLIAAVPGYEGEAESLSGLLAAGRIRFVPALADRAQATLTGVILLGPEALSSNLLSLAETLVHEQHHRRQFPLLKTASFWAGVVTGTHVMRRYERPAYEAALRFLEAAERALPGWAAEARAERRAVAASFQTHYGDVLT